MAETSGVGPGHQNLGACTPGGVMTEGFLQRFADKVVVITGAGSGIGRATAVRLATEGATVVAADITDGVNEVVAEIREAGGTADAIQADVSDRAGAEAPIDFAVENHGRLDVLCNIAGVLSSCHSHEETDENWDRLIGINLNGVFYTTRRALPELVESKGNIVMAASTSSMAGHPYMWAYATTKGGVLAMTHTLAVEYARRGVRVNAVAPGGIATPMVSGVRLPDDADFTLMDRISPLDEFRGPETVAGVIAFLASDDGAHVNGEVVRIDGASLA